MTTSATSTSSSSSSSSSSRDSVRTFLRAIRRPLILGVVCLLFLLAHHILLRAMVHGHVAHVLLGAGNAPPDPSAATLAISLVIVRFITVVIVPGLGLAAAAEIVAYFLVGPKRTSASEGEDDDEELKEEPSSPALIEEEVPRSQSHSPR